MIQQGRKWYFAFRLGTESEGSYGLVLNLLMVFYSIEISTLFTLILFTITHAFTDTTLIAWVVLIFVILVFFYIFIIRNVKNTQNTIHSSLSISDMKEGLEVESGPYTETRLEEFNVKQPLLNILSKTNSENSDELQTQEIDKEWEVIKIHLIFLLQTLSEWLDSVYNGGFLYMIKKCNDNILITNHKETSTPDTYKGLIHCFFVNECKVDEVTIKKQEQMGVSYKITPLHLKVSLKSEELNLYLILNFTGLGAIPKMVEGVPFRQESLATVQLSFLSKRQVIKSSFRGLLPSDINKILKPLKNIESLYPHFKSYNLNRRYIPMKMDAIKIGKHTIPDKVKIVWSMDSDI